MDSKRYEQICDDTKAMIDRINQSKGLDYAGSDDRLANFKRNAKNLHLEPEQVWAVYAAKHWDAIMTWVRECNNPNYNPSEPITGRLDDLIVYSILAKALWQERAEEWVNKQTYSGSRIHKRDENKVFIGVDMARGEGVTVIGSRLHHQDVAGPKLDGEGFSPGRGDDANYVFKTIEFNAAEYLNSPQMIIEYLRQALDDGDLRLIEAALKDAQDALAKHLIPPTVRWLEYIEPFGEMGGQATIRVSEAEAIKLSKEAARLRPAVKFEYGSDEAALEDFIVVHMANYVQ